MADEAITAWTLLLLARADSPRFAVSREFDAKSTNACWLGFKLDGLA